MGCYIPNADVEGLAPNTYFEGPKADENGIYWDENVKKLVIVK
jgi:hypothetical protein